MKNTIIALITIFLILIAMNNVVVMNCTVTGERDNQPGVYDAIDQDGYGAAYENASPGDKITSVLIFNPLTQYDDDILWRIDFRETGVEII